jgi:hypothetical protein
MTTVKRLILWLQTLLKWVEICIQIVKGLVLQNQNAVKFT